MKDKTRAKNDNDAPKEKTLLDGCSATVRPGEVLAIMGPSGAGKTTLLNTLTLEPSGGKPFGTVTLNGQPFTLPVYKQHAAVVQQSESLWTFLTARQHIVYAVRLYQPLRDADAYVDSVLKEMGLVSCQHVKAGNQFFKGLSGGQRRRLSLAVALTKEPSIVFLDEPTSGLDAAAAASIMTFLRESAPALGVAMVCTVHQPSTSVFAGFDKVCFLTGGKICYLGAAAELGEYLAEIGRPVAPNSNPADFMLDLINRDFVEETTVDFMVEKWAERAPEVAETAPSTLLAPPPTAAFMGQLRVLLSKHSLLVLRDPTIYSGRVVMAMISLIFFAVMYIQTRNRVQTQAYHLPERGLTRGASRATAVIAPCEATDLPPAVC